MKSMNEISQRLGGTDDSAHAATTKRGRQNSATTLSFSGATWFTCFGVRIEAQNHKFQHDVLVLPLRKSFQCVQL